MNSVPEHEVRRPGWKSSEFWVTLLATALPFLLPVLEQLVGRLPADSNNAVIGSAIVALGYNISRGLVKKSRNDASAVAAGPSTINAATANTSTGVEAGQGEEGSLAFRDAVPRGEVRESE